MKELTGSFEMNVNNIKVLTDRQNITSICRLCYIHDEDSIFDRCTTSNFFLSFSLLGNCKTPS